MQPVGSRQPQTDIQVTVKNLKEKSSNPLMNALKENAEGIVIEDKAEISDTSKAFSKLDKFLNLGAKDRLDISDLNKEERAEFLKMLAAVIQKGVVGYEVLEIDGKPEKHFIVNQIGNERTYGAKLYKKRWPER